MTPKRILALDPATLFGFAMWDRDEGLLNNGVLKLTGPDDADKMVQWADWIVSINETFAPSIILYEKPVVYGHKMNRGVNSLAFNLEGVTKLVCGRHSIPYEPVTPAAVKKAATGKGNSSKPLVRKAMGPRWGVKTIDDNHADALAVLCWGVANLEA